MSLIPLLSSDPVKAAGATAAVSTAKTMTEQGMIQVAPAVATLISMALALSGIWLARTVSITKENKRLGRVQTWRETGPWTWIGVLLVCPLIWHFEIGIPFAAPIGLGIGASVQAILKILGEGAADAARAIVRRASMSLDEDAELGLPEAPKSPGLGDARANRSVLVAPPSDLPADQAELIARIDDVTGTPRPLPPPPENG